MKTKLLLDLITSLLLIFSTKITMFLWKMKLRPLHFMRFYSLLRSFALYSLFFT